METHTHNNTQLGPPGPRRSCRGEAGMTLVEVLVSMGVLLVGMLGVVSMLDISNRTTDDNLTRDTAVALAREELERAREVPFTSLSDVTNVVNRVTSVMPGVDAASKVATTMPSVLAGLAAASASNLSNYIPGAPTAAQLASLPLPAIKFNITRRRLAFASTLSTCVLDDPSDGIGPAPGSPCQTIPVASGGGGTSNSGGAGSLNLNILGIGLTGSGSLVSNLVCSLFGTRGSVVDGLLGGGGLLSGLISTGADTTYCAGKGNVAFDRQAADAVAITTVVEYTYPGTTRTGTVTERVVVGGPRVTS